jgi:exocyst complex component 6
MKDYEKLVLSYQLQDESIDNALNEDDSASKTVFDTIMMDQDELAMDQKQKIRKISEHIKFPITLAFSITVPRICRGVKRFIHDYYVFARNLPSMDKQIRKAVDEILEKEVDKFMNSLIDESPSLNISQAVQIAINSSYLSKACDFFEKYASSFVSSRSILELDEESLKLKVRRVFNRTMERSQNMIFELINSKIDGFLLGLGGNTEWMPSKLNKNPSGIINDLITYLETSFVMFTYLPLHIRQGIQFTTCRHIAETLMGSLLETKKYNIIYIYNLNLDVKCFEEYAKRQSTTGLISCFSEIRQFIDLLLSGNVEQILDKPTREAKFPHLANDKLYHLLDKFKDLGLMQQIPAEVPKLKRSNFNAILKRLKD